MFCIPSVNSRIAGLFEEPEPIEEIAALNPPPMVVEPPATIDPICPVVNGAGPTSIGFLLATGPGDEFTIAE